MAKDMVRKRLGERIAELREKKGMSQSDLARACDKDSQSINRIERRNVNPTYKYLLEICIGLEITMSELFDFDQGV